MKRFRLFSIKNSLLIASLMVVLSCVSKSGLRKDDFIAYQGSQWFYSPQEKIIDKRCGSKCKPQDLLGIYCRKGKQIRPLVTRFEAIVSQPPKGMAVDDAGELREQVHIVLRDIIKDYYRWGLRPRKYFMIPPNPDGMPTYSPKNIFGLPFNDQESLRQYLKESRINTDRVNPILIADRQGKKPILLSLVRLPIYGAWGGSGKDDYVIGEERPPYSPYYGEMVFGEPSEKPFVVHSKDSSYRRQSTGNIIYPLRLMVPLEPAAFWLSYTMLIPLDVQKKIFDLNGLRTSTCEEGRCLADYKGNDRSNGFFVNSDGTFDIRNAIRDREELWDVYIQHFIKLKEAQTADPQIVKYEVSLDLNPFCAYGRAVEDLLSK